MEMDERINSELESLKIQNILLEKELDLWRMRSESAEEELRQLKATIRLSACKITTLMDSPAASIPPPPPPPPPMPSFSLNSLNTNKSRSRSDSQTSLTFSGAINDAQTKLQHTQNDSKDTRIATGRTNWNFLILLSLSLSLSCSPLTLCQLCAYLSISYSYIHTLDRKHWKGSKFSLT